MFACDESYRKSTEKINRIRWENKNPIKTKTLANTVTNEGLSIQNHIEEKVRKILVANKFNEDGTLDKVKIPAPDLLEESLINSKVVEYNACLEKDKQIELTSLHDFYENPDTAVNVSVDDVGVKKQKESGRSKYSTKKEHREYVQNTVVHIQNGKKSYVINSIGTVKTLRLVIAFLLNNDLLSNGNLVFYVDGAKSIHSGILKMFSWIPYKVILDWYHLIEKCKIQLSLAIKGKEKRNEVLNEIKSLLWLGKTEQAMIVLENLNPTYIKSSNELYTLINYFKRNWHSIPCYALRKKLGLRNSSNLGEKSNDLLVADRQKHNGMSWSKMGSSTLASVITLHKNNEHMNWLVNKSIDFKFSA
jgi:hypothetical protein